MLATGIRSVNIYRNNQLQFECDAVAKNKTNLQNHEFQSY